MRCRPCGAPRNPNAERCEYCQSWHEARNRGPLPYNFNATISQEVSREGWQALRNAQDQMEANDAQYQIQRSCLPGLGRSLVGYYMRGII